ncbi:MAG TPA: RNA polymerase sigma factor [Polyangia bacterium]
MTDETLIAAFKNGDAAAFSALVLRHEKPLWNYIRRFIRDRAAAEDVMQEALLRALRAAPQWEPNAKFSTWLYTIARNLCVDHARRMVHRAAGSLDASDGGGHGEGGSGSPRSPRIDRVVGSDPGGEASALSQETAARIEAAIGTLPDDQREVFLMREVMDMPFAEIAEAVGVPLATVKSRMRYALGRLREALQDLREAEPKPTLAAPLAASVELP